MARKKLKCFKDDLNTEESIIGEKRIRYDGIHNNEESNDDEDKSDNDDEQEDESFDRYLTKNKSNTTAMDT
jgi:hypothetical protein